MGNTVWILKEGQESDDWDHSLLLTYETQLDAICDDLKISKLSHFYDFSILAEEFETQDTPKFIYPREISPDLLKLLSALKSDKSKLNDLELIEEIEDCIKKLNEAYDLNSRVRIAIIP